MEYEDTNILRTQYVDDLVKQRQNLENIMVKQNVEVVTGEGLESMIDKVKTMEGMEALPYYNFYNCYSTEMANRVKTLNFASQTNFDMCFYNWKSCDLRNVNTINAKSMKHIFGRDASGVGQVIRLGKNFRMDNVEDAQGFFAKYPLSSYIGAYMPIINVDEVIPHEASKLTSLSYFMAGIDMLYLGNYYVQTIKGIHDFLKKIHFPNVTDCSCMFYRSDICIYSSDEDAIGAFVEFCDDIFGKCIDSSKIVDAYNMFNGYSDSRPLGADIRTSGFHNIIKNLDGSNIENAEAMFMDCDIRIADTIDLSHIIMPKVTNIKNMLRRMMGAYSSTEKAYVTTLKAPVIPNESITSIENLLYDTEMFRTIDLSKINMGGVKTTNSTSFQGYSTYNYLKNLYMGYNLGKSYVYAANNSYHTIDLSKSSDLSRECIVDLFGKIYDLNITYNVANGGTLKTQKIDLHANVLAKLTADDILIATNKGWTVV